MCEIVGEYSELNSEKLPTYLEVMKYYYFEYEKMYQKERRYLLFSVVSKLVLDEVKNIWSRTSITIVFYQRIITMIKNIMMLLTFFIDILPKTDTKSSYTN